MIAQFLFLLEAAAAPLPSGQEQLVACYAQQAQNLWRSTEAAPVVADAVMALCVNLEPAAKAELIESSIQSVLEATGGSRDEAARAVKSVEEESWRAWRSNMRDQISASIVRYRVNQPPK